MYVVSRTRMSHQQQTVLPKPALSDMSAFSRSPPHVHLWLPMVNTVVQKSGINSLSRAGNGGTPQAHPGTAWQRSMHPREWSLSTIAFWLRAPPKKNPKKNQPSPFRKQIKQLRIIAKLPGYGHGRRIPRDHHVRVNMLTRTSLQVDRCMAQSACDEPWDDIGQVHPQSATYCERGIRMSGCNNFVVSSTEAHCGSASGQ